MKGSIRGGHNYGVPGASGIIDEVKEDRKYYPFVISNLVREGFNIKDVTPNRTSTTGQDLSYGVSKCNDFGSDFFISCHLNSYNGSARGCEVLYHKSSSSGKKLAECIVAELAKLGFPNRGAKADTRGLYELRHTKCTAVIVEPFFLDNLQDVEIYRRVGAQGIANAISNGVLKYYGKNPTYNSNKKNTYSVNYCKEFQKFYNTVTQTRAPLIKDGIFGLRTESAFNTIKSLVLYNQYPTPYCKEFQKFYNRVTQTGLPITEDNIAGNNTKQALNTIEKLIRGEY